MFRTSAKASSAFMRLATAVAASTAHNSLSTPAISSAVALMPYRCNLAVPLNQTSLLLLQEIRSQYRGYAGGRQTLPEESGGESEVIDSDGDIEFSDDMSDDFGDEDGDEAEVDDEFK